MDDVYLPGQVDSDEYPAEHPDLPPAAPGAFPGAAGGFTLRWAVAQEALNGPHNPDFPFLPTVSAPRAFPPEYFAMGLDTSHDCWHGSYSGFGRWRDRLAAAAGIPLRLMDGFYEAPDPTSMAWAAPREGGPLCGSHHGPFLHAWVRKASELLPIAWSSLRPDVLHELLNHSDCDGTIPAEVCAPLAGRLAELIPLLPDDEFRHRDATQRFIDGLRLAAKAGESVEFH